MIGQKIKELRKEKNWSLRALAEKASISKSTLSDIENGNTNPTANTLVKIAEALGVTVENFFKDESADDKTKIFSDNLNNLDNEESKLSYLSAVMDFAEPEDVVKFILEQPMFMAYGGYDLKSMSNEEILEIAQDMLFAMKLSLEKRKKNK